MAAPPVGQMADTRIMGIVHRALRRDLARTRAVLTDEAPPLDSQREAIAEHLIWMMAFLHRHHESEDAVLYPLLRERAPREATDLLDAMADQHHAILEPMQRLEAAAAAYRADSTVRDDVLDAVGDLESVLFPHLDREEQEAMPLAAAYVTQAEWDRWDDEYNVKPLPPLELADTGLWVLDGLEGEEFELVTNLVPPVTRWIILHVMSRRYRRQSFRRWRAAETSPYAMPHQMRTEVVVDAKPDEVWAVLSDVTRTGEWSHECHTVQWLGGATELAPGVQFVGSNRNGRFRWSRPCTVTSVLPGRELTFETDGGIWTDCSEWRFRLEPEGGGTRIVQSYRVVTGNPVVTRLICLVLPAHVDRSTALRADLERLGEVAARERVLVG